MSAHPTLKEEHGFTIVELMIALSVLSVLLVMSTVLLMQISKMYSKGVNMANIQNANRNLVNDVASALEFGDAVPQFGTYTYAPAGGSGVLVKSLCLGTKRYSYIVGQQVAESPVYHPDTGDPQTYHAMWEDTMQNAGQCYPMDITRSTPGNPTDPLGVPTSTAPDQSGRELIPVHSRLASFDIAQKDDGNGGYVFDVNASLAYGDNDLLNVVDGNTLCKGDAGQEYCATSHLNTSATRRLK